MTNYIIICYLLLLNFVTFTLFGIDKQKARRSKWRIPESRFLLFATLGGSPGALAGMYFFHHKTRHLKFTLGIPFILILQIIAIVYLVCPQG